MMYGQEDDEEENKLSPEEIRDVINSYTSFKYEDNGADANCAICIDKLKDG